MKNRFQHTPPAKPSPVVFEQVFAEKPGGGVVPEPSYDLMQGTAVGAEGKPIKAYRLAKAVAAADATIQIQKGSGVEVGDIIGHGKKAVACTNVDTSNPSYDVVTVTLGVAIDNDTVLYQAKAASDSAAEPIYNPVYVVGTEVYAGMGDQEVRLVNGANLRKETAPIAKEVVAMMKSIQLV